MWCFQSDGRGPCNNDRGAPAVIEYRSDEVPQRKRYLTGILRGDSPCENNTNQFGQHLFGIVNMHYYSDYLLKKLIFLKFELKDAELYLDTNGL